MLQSESFGTAYGGAPVMRFCTPWAASQAVWLNKQILISLYSDDRSKNSLWGKKASNEYPRFEVGVSIDRSPEFLSRKAGRKHRKHRGHRGHHKDTRNVSLCTTCIVPSCSHGYWCHSSPTTRATPALDSFRQ